MHILLTGGTGLIGRALCRHWAQQGHQLTVWSRTPQQVEALCGSGVRGIARLEELAAAARGRRSDASRRYSRWRSAFRWRAHWHGNPPSPAATSSPNKRPPARN